MLEIHLIYKQWKENTKLNLGKVKRKFKSKCSQDLENKEAIHLGIKTSEFGK